MAPKKYLRNPRYLLWAIIGVVLCGYGVIFAINSYYFADQAVSSIQVGKDNERNITVNGSAFFPIGFMYESSSDQAKDLREIDELTASGYNLLCLALNGYTDLDSIMAKMEANGAYAILPHENYDPAYINNNKKYANLFGYGVGDDAGLKNNGQYYRTPAEILDMNTKTKSLDGQHGTFLTFAGDVDTYTDFANIADINAIESYPIPYYWLPDVNYQLTDDVYARFDALNAAGKSAGKPTVGLVQVFSYKNQNPQNPGRWPTPNEMRYMTYSSIAAGAKGIIYYTAKDQLVDVHTENAALWAEMKKMPAEIKEISPFLLKGTYNRLLTDLGGVMLSSWTLGDETVFVAVNYSTEAKNINVPFTYNNSYKFEQKFQTDGQLKYSGTVLTGSVLPKQSVVYSIKRVVVEDKTPPSAPSNLTSANTTSSSTDLNWQAATDNVGVTSYLIHQYDTSWTQVGTVNSTSYTPTGLTPGKTYKFKITAKDAAGNVSGDSNEVAVLTKSEDTSSPTSPNNFRVLETTISSIKLGWNEATDNVGISGYRICKESNTTNFEAFKKSACGENQAITKTQELNFLDTGLPPSTRYAYKIQAYDAAGNSSQVVAVEGKTASLPDQVDKTPPSVPQAVILISAKALNDEVSVNLGWNQSTDNGGGKVNYKIYRDGLFLATSETTSFMDDNQLAANEDYDYQVTALDIFSNESDRSPVLTVTTPKMTYTKDLTPPSQPTNGSISMITNNSITLSWVPSTDNVGVKGYRVFRLDKGKSTYRFVGQATFTDTELLASTGYGYYIVAEDEAGNLSTASKTYWVKTKKKTLTGDRQPPSKPTNLKIATKTINSISISWAPSKDNVMVAGYKIYRGNSYIGTTTTTGYMDTGLASGKTYIYRVSAYDTSQNESAKSNSVSATTEKTKLETVSFSGIVVDGETNTGVKGATVYLEKVDEKVTYSTNTIDESGSFSWPFVKKGTYKMRLSAPNHIDYINENFIIVASSSNVSQEVVITPSVTLSGKIVNQKNNQPVEADIEIYADGNLMANGHSQKNDGAYTLNKNVPPGKLITVKVSAKNFETRELQLDTGKAQKDNSNMLVLLQNIELRKLSWWETIWSQVKSFWGKYFRNMT